MILISIKMDKNILLQAYKPPIFNGESDEWYKWSHRFMAGAKIKGYSKVMVDTAAINMTDEFAKLSKDYKVLELEACDHQLKYDLMTAMEQSFNFNHIVACET